MFWQKPLLFLSVLAAVGNTAPFAPLGQDYTNLENGTRSLSKRNFEDPSDEFLVFRADTRTPDQIKAAGGFKPKGGVGGDVSLFNHCKGNAKSFDSASNDGYVSTSAAFDACADWIEDHLDKGVIYGIATYQNLVDCQLTLKGYNPIPDEVEFAALDGIPWEQITGWWDQITVRNKEVVEARYTANPQFNTRKYKNQKDAGAQYQLAGFPPKHKAWKELPWSKVAGCTDKSIKANPSRRFIDIFARRTKSTKPKTTKPKITAPKGTPPKATPSTTPTSKTCTSAHKKAGKCKEDTGATCAPRKTNKQFYDEYVKLLKAGKPPKSGAPTRGGMKKKPGKKVGGS